MSTYLKVSNGPLGSSQDIRHRNEMVLDHFDLPFHTIGTHTGSSIMKGTGKMDGVNIVIDPKKERTAFVFFAQFWTNGSLIPAGVLTNEIPDAKGSIIRTLTITMSKIWVKYLGMRQNMLFVTLDPNHIDWSQR